MDIRWDHIGVDDLNGRQYVDNFIANGGDTSFIANGDNILHLAVRSGNIGLVEAVLQLARIPWNSLNSVGKSVGEIALECGHTKLYSILVGHGVRTEFVLALVGQKVIEDGDLVIPCSLTDSNQEQVVDQHEYDKIISNKNYLDRQLIFSVDGSKLLDTDQNAVMMGWEDPLMKLHAKLMTPAGKSVLNIGFGLGIIDGYIQELKPCRHTIVEAHPDVYKKMIEDGWDKIEGVVILFGRWQDMIDQFECYDSIFYDTFGIPRSFNYAYKLLPNILDEGGVYSFFNGLAGTNQFFHDVACEIARIDLNEIGLDVQYREVPMETMGDDIWHDTKRAYWSLPVYRLPTCTFNL